MAYRIEYAPAAVRALRGLDRMIQRRILSKIEALQSDPRPASSIKLGGHEAYRIRIGDYRAIYAIADAQLLILVVEIGHRREVYRSW